LQDNTISLNARTVVTANECGAIITNFIPFPQSWGEKVTSQKEERMYDHDIDFDTINAGTIKGYLSSRAYEAREEHDKVLRKHFHIDNDDEPTTIGEFLSRIKNDQFVLKDPESKDKPGFYSWHQCPQYFLKWRNPEIEADQTGYAAADSKLEEAFGILMDEIIVFEPNDGLDALNNFREATFH
jgi:hypothetical protein